MRSVFTQELVLDRFIVGHITQFLVLGCEPDPVPAADHPFGFAVFAHLLGVVFEDVLAVRSLVGEDPGADVQGDDELDVVVAQAGVVLPAFVGDVLDLHGGLV